MLVTPPSDARQGPVWTSAMMTGLKMRYFGLGAVVPLTTAWPTANLAILVPFSVSVPVTFKEIFFQSGATPGTANYDLGIYSDTFTRIASLGATASVNTTDAIQPVGGGAFSSPVTLNRGRYYIAMSAAATTITVRALTPGNAIPRAFGCLSATTSQPLPTTITAASASTIIPIMGLATIDNIL